MKNLFFVVFGLIFLSSAACKRECPPDVKIGDKPLTAKSKEFFPYRGSPVLVFKDDAGEELRLKADTEVKTEPVKIPVYKKCSELKYDGKSSYEYFEGELMYVTFFAESGDYVAEMKLTTRNLKPEHELFYDLLTVNVSGVAAIGRGELVTDVRFTEPHDSSEFNLTAPMEYIGDLTLGGTDYTEVYQTEQFDGRRVYYNKAKGIVGFTEPPKTYHLDRIE